MWYPEAERGDPKLKMTSKELAAFYADLRKDFPIVTIEDPSDQDDWGGWTEMTAATPEADVPPAKLPAAESLEMTRARVLPYWNGTIKPVLATGGKTVLVCAHGNSLHALLMELDGVDEKTIPGINIPTGTPLVYDLDACLKVIPKAGAVAPLNGAYLGDAAEVAAKAAAVAAQTEKK